MKRPKISRRAETRPYGRVSAPTGNCRKFLTQLRANDLRSDVLQPGRGRKLDQGAEERSVPGPMLQRPLERQRTPAPAERTGPMPSIA